MTMYKLRAGQCSFNRGGVTYVRGQLYSADDPGVRKMIECFMVAEVEEAPVAEVEEAPVAEVEEAPVAEVEEAPVADKPTTEVEDTGFYED